MPAVSPGQGWAFLGLQPGVVLPPSESWLLDLQSILCLATRTFYPEEIVSRCVILGRLGTCYEDQARFKLKGAHLPLRPER